MTSAQKTPLARTLNDFATQKALDAISELGMSLPATVTAVQGSIITVSFDIQSTIFTLPNVTIPKAESEWLRSPTQVGDHGMVMPSDVSLGASSGLGGGTATLGIIPNLSALVWVPVANQSWEMDDEGSALINGPNGVIIRDKGKNCIVTIGTTQITVNGKTELLLEVGAVNITVTSNGIALNGPITLNGVVSGETGDIVNFGSATIQTTGAANVGSIDSTGDVTANGISLETHIHGGVTTGSGDTGPPV